MMVRRFFRPNDPLTNLSNKTLTMRFGARTTAALQFLLFLVTFGLALSAFVLALEHRDYLKTTPRAVSDGFDSDATLDTVPASKQLTMTTRVPGTTTSTSIPVQLPTWVVPAFYKDATLNNPTDFISWHPESGNLRINFAVQALAGQNYQFKDFFINLLGDKIDFNKVKMTVLPHVDARVSTAPTDDQHVQVFKSETVANTVIVFPWQGNTGQFASVLPTDVPVLIGDDDKQLPTATHALSNFYSLDLSGITLISESRVTE
jgi:hypothetical protein